MTTQNTPSAQYMRDGYLIDLAERLRARGLPADRVETTVTDLAAHLEESGAEDAEAEFGPADEFAAQLVPAAGERAPRTPDKAVETWRWTADTYVDEELLNRFGDEGWEVERVDALGRFVSHRDVAQPQRWEYRRELITRGRENLDERLAPDGWEACGTWIVYAWFKRPRAASLGPAARVESPPPVPERSRFFSRKFHVLLGVLALAVAAAGVSVAVDDGEASSGLGFVVGLFAGVVAVAGVMGALHMWRGRRP
ncbi:MULTISPECIES: hypothetical protein [unclassified Streptomyces]|uniref:hypothetical protein n=1 Tax=unclassified Streptomyces TaxID=2593676 RepID=UPI00136D0EBC|nr:MULTISPECIES: hypothetical protein [unclassified Streptomyces]NEA00508.1 hypothetical protein [Streptomyces sp. SID10116]MYY82300.1 hypothetical protein [Streptomyces sp. SID335]MYZ18036.1 hypothetical protein [Streptomyces sp. SID337]NDZ87353.1 hypothetical protein [Streptomyces sp. SID10115]NEB44918.1 hypothetical protein [Streptomyces sp. SID339]